MLSSQLIWSALESAPDAILICDASGRIVFVNTQVTVLFGYEEHEILGHLVEQLLPERYRARHLDHRQGYTRAPSARSMRPELRLLGLRKDGTEIPVEISLSPIRDGSALLVVAAIRDVTERRRAETELLAAREAADRANLAKSRFLASASHDLRQPLQALALLNGVLSRRALPANVSEMIAEQEHTITAMSHLVNALLDISKLESGAIKPEIADFEVASLFAELRREFASLAQRKGLELQVEACADSVRSDPSLIEQVVRNLVSNAIKYTQRGRVLLRCLHEPKVVRLEVLDTGIGIPAEQIPFIFDEFFQVGVGANRSRNGYGLGLSIVKRIVKLLDLKLDVHSQPGIGSSFSLALPASRARPAGIARPQLCDVRSELPSRVRRIFLVEDDAGVRHAERLLLEAEGCQITTASSVKEALLKLGEQSSVDLLICDFHLGVGDTCLELIAAFRQRVSASLPVILLTGDTSAAIRALAQDERWRLASKPLQADQLLALMDELLRR